MVTSNPPATSGTPAQIYVIRHGEKPADPPSALKAWLEQKGHAAVEIKEIEATIEDCFIRLMSNTRDDPDDQANQPGPNPRSADALFSNQTLKPKE